ncbi:component IIC of galactitol-specific phosphotransferase system [Citrobacter koseri]|uniref:Component IIC of galactitol-specific phosphotransferase system n=1 Tax=Citrobacter koseri TaxID=545 RepID=A0A447UL70_CITKO|nr:component IIC of galactitol-specific phosphotransferase system [Citrobacter koseri]
MLPLVIIVFSKLLGMKLGDCFKSGLHIGIGFVWYWAGDWSDARLYRTCGESHGRTVPDKTCMLLISAGRVRLR